MIYKVRLYILSLKKKIKGRLLRLGCLFFSSWYFIDSDCISTTGKVLKLDRIYTYKEGDNVEIVRLINVHTERKYLYCSLFFFTMNKIITVRQTMLKDAPVLLSLSDNKDFDEIMSIKLWEEVNKEEELLEFDF
ncbi:MAG: hypothetical protein GYA51_09715 [Candidatus Methanofastidiosa archaeon]|nr:hypothetical protein [Candidatus Methanofastidiosa archaeon]